MTQEPRGFDAVRPQQGQDFLVLEFRALEDGLSERPIAIDRREVSTCRIEIERELIEPLKQPFVGPDHGNDAGECGIGKIVGETLGLGAAEQDDPVSIVDSAGAGIDGPRSTVESSKVTFKPPQKMQAIDTSNQKR